MPMTTVPGATSTPELRAHLATPTGSGPRPGVVVLHEAYGLNDDIRRITDRFAEAGYVAVAPDLYSAGGARRCLRATFRTLFAGEGPTFQDIEATRRWLADRPECTGQVGVAGFCLGGGFALLASTRGFDAAAPSYGLVPKDPEKALAGARPVVASFGARDRAARGAAGRLETALTTLDVQHDVKEYAGAGHSFLNRRRPGPLTALLRIAGVGYHHESAQDAWCRILAFFETQLGDPG